MGLALAIGVEVAMAPIYKEAGFPADYREAEVGRIMGAVYKLRSIAVSGLAGMGKSNVVRFVVSHPQVQQRYLKEKANDYAFVHIDCASLASGDEAQILNEITAQLAREVTSAEAAYLPDMHDRIRRVLKDQILRLDPNLNLVLAFDYFDEAAARLDKAFFNYLFHLRNTRPRGNLSFVLATRRPMGHLYELQELLDDSCVIGPLNHKDALASIQRDEARLGCTFAAPQRDKLVACTGGHPGFLKNAAELLESGEIDTSLPDERIARQLLHSTKVNNLCQELWEDLTREEQRILSNVASGLPLPQSVARADITYLEQTGLLARGKGEMGEPGAVIFCPLFAAFVSQVKHTIPNGLRITAIFPNQACIQTSTGEERITLPPKLFVLLLVLAEAGNQVLPGDEIISRVYGREAIGVTDAALSQLVKRLRGTLDPHVRRLTNDPACTCVETIRDVGYRFNG